MSPACKHEDLPVLIKAELVWAEFPKNIEESTLKLLHHGVVKEENGKFPWDIKSIKIRRIRSSQCNFGEAVKKLALTGHSEDAVNLSWILILILWIMGFKKYLFRSPLCNPAELELGGKGVHKEGNDKIIVVISEQLKWDHSSIEIPIIIISEQCHQSCIYRK